MPRMRRITSRRGLRRRSWTGRLSGAQDAPDHQPPRCPSPELDGRPGRLGKPGFGLLLSGPFRLHFSKVPQIRKIAHRRGGLAARFGPPSPPFKKIPPGGPSTAWAGEGWRALRRRSWPGGLEGAQDAPEGELPRCPSPELDGRPGRRAGCAGRVTGEGSTGPAGQRA